VGLSLPTVFLAESVAGVVIVRKLHATLHWCEPDSLAPQLAMETVISWLVDKAGGVQAYCFFTRPGGDLVADVTIVDRR
jgi:hypothetical protein